jgi:hypothetical protein
VCAVVCGAALTEVDAADAAVGVDLDAQGLDVVGAVGAAREVRQVELFPRAGVMGSVVREGEGWELC